MDLSVIVPAFIAVCTLAVTVFCVLIAWLLGKRYGDHVREIERFRTASEDLQEKIFAVSEQAQRNHDRQSLAIGTLESMLNANSLAAQIKSHSTRAGIDYARDSAIKEELERLEEKTKQCENELRCLVDKGSLLRTIERMKYMTPTSESIDFLNSLLLITSDDEERQAVGNVLSVVRYEHEKARALERKA